MVRFINYLYFFYQDGPVITEHLLLFITLFYFLPTLISFKCMFVSLVAFEYAFRIQKLLYLENEYAIQRSGICKFGFNERQLRRAKGFD